MSDQNSTPRAEVTAALAADHATAASAARAATAAATLARRNGHASGAPRRPHVVIIGGGFGGLQAARALAKGDVDVTLVDRTNHHVFQPLLYQVAMAVLSEADIVVPIRVALRKVRNCTVLMADVKAIDVERKSIFLDDERHELPYDYLIVAAGARHAYFGHDEWEAVAPGLKSMADAYEMRRGFLTAFEEAEKTPDPAERRAWLTFVIVGAGPTGVELAGMIPGTAREFRKDFRTFDPAKEVRVLLVEGGPKVLPYIHQSLADRAKKDLEELGVTVRLNSIVTDVQRDHVMIGEERIPTRTVFWAAGNAASSLGAQLGVPVDRSGRVSVEADMSVPGRREVFVVGDMVHYVENGRVIPAVAPAANQQGILAGKNILADLAGRPRGTFKYYDKGDLATIGRHKAVMAWKGIRMGGYLAWWAWLVIHILYLAGFRNRISVMLQWAYSYLSRQRGVRLISGEMARHYSTGVPAEPPSRDVPVPGWK